MAHLFSGIAPRQTARGGKRFSCLALPVAVLATALLFVFTSVGSASQSATNAKRGVQPAGQAAGSLDLIREVGRGTMALEAPSHPALLQLGSGYTLDPSAGDPTAALPAELRASEPRGTERGAFLVQFRGPLVPGDRELLEAEGGTVLGYIPDYGLLVGLSGDARSRIAEAPRVAWIGLYQPAYKISSRPEMRSTGRREMLLLLFPEHSIESVSQAVASKGAVIREASDSGINKILRAEVDTADLASIAQIPGVAWIEPYVPVVLFNNLDQWVVQTSQSENRRVWDMGIRGEGQVINVVDSGIRTTHLQFNDPNVAILDFGDFPNHRKIIAYKKTVESPNILFQDEAHNVYHGTHTSCTAAGSDDPNGNLDNRDGMAKGGKIYFQDGGGTDTGILIALDLNTIFIHPYNGNEGGAARITTNSWGSSNGGAYDVLCMTADQFMWNHPDFLAFFANGNDGGPATVGSPASAKNVVSAGGTQNGASQNLIYTSTSRGPTQDGRRKPTICAPGQNINSAMGGTDAAYWGLSGTSMACPSMAGATTLIRQYLTEGWYPTGSPVSENAIEAPSAALLKAMAINSALPNVSGFTVPDNNIGWGRITVDEALYFPGDQRRLALVDNTEGLLTGEFVEYQVNVASSSLPLKAALVWTDYPGNPNASVQLVNNLNLIASDGINTYKGNVYSGGQSQTGGTFDLLNVEECVRLNSPTVGIWTFRIEGANVPFGEQPFALVVTGDLGSDQALITLDKSYYGGSGDVGIRVVDTNAGATISVTVTSDTEPGTETLVLPGADGVYEGSLPLTLGLAQSENGELSVSNGDQITATYQDTNPSATLVATAQVDILGPVLSNVGVSQVSESDATVTWLSSTQATSKVYYGTTPGLGSESDLSPAPTNNHAVHLTDLEVNQTYFYDVESSDNQGNTVRDNNGGFHYTFTTDQARDVLLVIGNETFDKKNYYDNAFDRSGWTYTVWQGNQAANPLVGDANSGLASYKAVVWQTGLEQYPPISDAGRDSIAKYHDVGSRFAIYSHDVAWDFCDPSAPDFSTERRNWFQDELHAIYQEDPGTWSINTGLAGDPISGDYTVGIAYFPHRTGAAGDEIQGLAGDGSVAAVWRNNDTVVGDIAVRWTGALPVGDQNSSVWGGTPNKAVTNCFELVGLNGTSDDDIDRADVLDKTIRWLIGHGHPELDLVSPNGGEIFTGSSLPITWTEAADGGFTIATRKLFYSDNGGASWNLITSSAGPSPFVWNISAIPNGAQYRIKVAIQDSASPALNAVDASENNFTINRPGGDTRGPTIRAGSITVDPNPIVIPDPATLRATVTDVQTGNSNIAAAEWSHGASPAAPGAGTAMNGSFISPVVQVMVTMDTESLTPGTTTLWVRGRDAAGNWGNASSLAVVVNTTEPTSVDENGLPGSFALHRNAPNPFNPITSIRFDLPRSTHVRLQIHDVTGRKIRTLLEGDQAAGSKSVLWDGRDEGGRALGSGTYFYRLEAGAFRATRKMTLLK